MQPKVRATALLCFVSLANQVGSGQKDLDPLSNAQEDRDTYAIYSMLITQDEQYKDSRITGIRSETVMPKVFAEEGKPCLPHPLPEQRRLHQPLIDDFVKRITQPHQLKRKFDLPAYRLVTAKDEQVIGWKHPFVPPPPGTPWPPETDPKLDGIEFVYRLSPVAFSADHNGALVYIETRYGGQYHFLLKRNGKWTVDKHFGGDVCYWVV